MIPERAIATAAIEPGSRYSRHDMLELPDLGSNLPDIVLRTTVVYLFVVAAIRSHGLTRVEDVRLAVLETDGSISVIPLHDASDRAPDQPSAEDRSA